MKKKLIVILLMLACCGKWSCIEAQIRMPELPKHHNYVDHTEYNSGFWCAIEGNGGSSLVFRHTNFQRVGLTLTGGYMINEYIKFGMGLGGNYYCNNNSNCRHTKVAFTMPIFFDVRGNLVSQEVRNFVPYWSLDLGGAAGDGFFMSPTIGMRFGQKRDSWLLGIAYTLNRINNNPGYPKTVSTFAIKFGYEF